jgi:hypothetical protein
VNWNTVSSAIKYRVRVKNIATGQSTLYFVNAPDTTKAFTGLAPNTLYKVRVRSQCSTGGSTLSPWSSPVYFTTLPGTASACVAPSDFSSSVLSGTSAFISWTAVSGSNGYQLRHRPIGSTTWTPVVVNNGMAGGVLLNGVQPNTDYQYQVRTKCSVTPLTWSSYSSLNLFSTPLRLGEDDVLARIQLYPNPSAGSVTFNANGLVGELTVYDAVGKTIFHQAVSTETALTDLPAGFLTYRFVADGGLRFNGKIAVMR